MNAMQENFNENVKQITEMQSRAFEPMRIFGGLAAETMEQVIRKNYAVMGDLVEFTVKQAQRPVSGENTGDLMAAQISDLSEFSELMGTRATEYVELASTFSERARTATDEAGSHVRELASDVSDRARDAANEASERATKAADEAANRVRKTAKAA